MLSALGFESPCPHQGSLNRFLALIGVLLTIEEGSLAAWLSLIASMCEFVCAIFDCIKEDCAMKKVLSLVGTGVSGVP